MSNLISRQALCDNLREYKVHPVSVFSSDESEIKGYNDGIDLAISVIAEFPSVEPEQTVKVEQIPDEEGTVWDVCECGMDVYRAWIYCPLCGARLEWE